MKTLSSSYAYHPTIAAIFWVPRLSRSSANLPASGEVTFAVIVLPDMLHVTAESSKCEIRSARSSSVTNSAPAAYIFEMKSVNIAVV
jgi:hypothetical protein